MGCEWCKLESDGITPINQPFCAAQSRCFAGILGAISPYTGSVMGK